MVKMIIFFGLLLIIMMVNKAIFRIFRKFQRGVMLTAPIWEDLVWVMFTKIAWPFHLRVDSQSVNTQDMCIAKWQIIVNNYQDHTY